jgi:hypothetical protein
MFSLCRSLGRYKSLVHNRAVPKVSIAEGYLARHFLFPATAHFDILFFSSLLCVFLSISREISVTFVIFCIFHLILGIFIVHFVSFKVLMLFRMLD